MFTQNCSSKGNRVDFRNFWCSDLQYITLAEEVGCSGVCSSCCESLAATFLADELTLLAYFEGTWIGHSVGGRRLPPTFPHHMSSIAHQQYHYLPGHEFPRGIPPHI